MKIWMLNGSLDEWSATWEYCGFKTAQERAPISPGDCIIYYCNGLIVGVFEVQELMEVGFGSGKELPFQIRLKKIHVPEHGLVAGPLHYKISLQKHAPGSPTLWEISEWECSKIMQALAKGHKELMF